MVTRAGLTTVALSRRRLLVMAAALAVAPAFAAAPALGETRTIRIGVQKYGTLIVLQVRGALEKRLAPLGVGVEWTEFPGGPQLLEALAAGSIDFGTTGEAPPVFAQAAGAELVYSGVEPPAPKGEAILVPKDSPIKSVADLKGKRIALNKGSNVHYLLVQALAKVGLSPADVTPVYLAPADGRAAFESGDVDAWVIWDPFLAAAQKASDARILADGAGLVENRQYYLAYRSFAQSHPELLKIIQEEIARTDAWAAQHQPEVVQLLAKHTGLDSAAVTLAVSRLAYGTGPITPATVAYQQSIADTFFKLGLIPQQIRVADAAPGS
jgi:sulfonate transport system substrate-binding protein